MPVVLNDQPEAEAVSALLACCAVPRWAARVAAGRPYADVESLVAAALQAADFSPDEIDQALSAHPRIGERADGSSREAAWSRQEQSTAGADDADRELLRQENVAYEDRFGQVFLICATGRSVDEIRAALRDRMPNDPETERAVVADELRQIIALRLRKLVADDVS